LQLLDPLAPRAFAVRHRDRGFPLGLAIGFGDFEVDDQTVRFSMSARA
jgi:hypothetical protein